MENNNLTESVKNKFQEKFKKNGRLFFSPSRINLIGEHIDYNGGRVMPCAIDIGTYAVVDKNDENKLNLYSMNMKDEIISIPIDNLEYNEKMTWGNYASGMVKFIKESGYKIGGLDIVINGNIPYGSGLSSSASLEMLIGKIVNTVYNDDKIPPVEIVKMGQKVENIHFGLNSGIMDQFAVNMGKENSFILLDTSDLDYEYIKVDLEDNELVILNTNKNRELKDSKYNERFAQCKKALEIIKRYRNIENLCNLGEDTDILDKIDDEIIKKRAIHVVEENIRVNRMVQAIGKRDFRRMGELLSLSHKSLKECFEVTGFYLDSIVEGAEKSEYTLGARMTGAGFAGCAIALVKKEGLEEFSATVKTYYKEKTGLDASIIFANIAGGPREVL